MKASVGSETLVDEGLKQTGGDGKTKRWQQAVAGDSRKYGRHYRSENVEVRGTNKHINPQQTGRDDGKDASPVCSLSLSLFSCVYHTIFQPRCWSLTRGPPSVYLSICHVCSPASHSEWVLVLQSELPPLDSGDPRKTQLKYTARRGMKGRREEGGMEGG